MKAIIDSLILASVIVLATLFVLMITDIIGTLISF